MYVNLQIQINDFSLGTNSSGLFCGSSHPFIIFIIIGIEGQTEDPKLMFKILLPNFPITALLREVTTKKLQLL